MSIMFSWSGTKESPVGVATYSSNESSYSFEFSSFAKANELYIFLSNAFYDGRRVGHTEMMQGVNAAMNDVARKP